MSAAFSATCTCGRVAVAPCPTLEEPDRAAGFGWHEGLGYRCGSWPACSPVPPAPAPSAPRLPFRQEPRQASLFPNEAA